VLPEDAAQAVGGVAPASGLVPVTLAEADLLQVKE